MEKQKVIPEKFRFSNVLTGEFPQYMWTALESWAKDVLKTEGFCDKYCEYLTQMFIGEYQVATRLVIDGSDVHNFLVRTFKDKDETIIFLQLMLKNFGKDEATNRRKCFGSELERILSTAGSAYASEIIKGEWALVERVPESVKVISSKIISSDTLLADAWKKCYGVRPNYNVVIQKSIDVLERLLRDNYLVDEKRPQLGKNIKDINSKKDLKMQFKGQETLDNPKVILELVKNLTKYRGEHTGGTGEDATKEIAEYALNATIFIWNLHN